MTNKRWNGLAIDLGASGGRIILGSFDGRTLHLEEMHRFENGPVTILNTLYWDVLRLYGDIQQGIRKAVTDLKGKGEIVATLGVDTWGVDFGLLNEQGHLLTNPVHYRDQRTQGMMEKVFQIIPRREIYQQTGIQFLLFNTLFQLAAMKFAQDPLLNQAKTLLMMPDLFRYFLTGEKAVEQTITSTTQLLDPYTGEWCSSLINQLNLPSTIFPSIIQPTTRVGKILNTVANEVGQSDIQVIASASHDTASAAAAVPVQKEKYAYISCGTWSCMGTELKSPVVNDISLKYNFTNEGGMNKTILFLTNIMGLWLLQELRREWSKQGKQLSWDTITQKAASAKSLACFIDPDDLGFLAPGDMSTRICNYCRDHGLPIPEDEGALARCIMESLVFKYRYVLERMETVLGYPFEVIHIIGGGVQNELLCQWTSNVTNRLVITGPVEATAIGNLACQLIAQGEVGSLSEARQLIIHSFPVKTYEPRDTEVWNSKYIKFKNLLES